MNNITRFGLACLFAIPTGCDKSLDWPSFDEKVIEVGRQVLQEQADQNKASYTAPPAEADAEAGARDEPIPATHEAVLKNVKVWVDVRGITGQRASKAIRNLGASAVDPLLEILADDSIPRRYTDRAVGLLIPLGYEPQDDSEFSGCKMLLPPAGRIFDAVVDYVQRHPESRANIGALHKTTPLDRIPRVIELIESSSSYRQESYIKLFNSLTYTSFPTIPHGFCGNSSPESTRRAIKEGEERQRESVGGIKTWWEEHKGESPDEWLEASVKRTVHDKTEDLKTWAAIESEDKSEQWGKNHSIRDYYPAHWGRWRVSVFDTLLDEFEKAPKYTKPYVLRMIASTRHPDAVPFIVPKLESADPNIQHAAVAALKDLKVRDHNEAIGRILRSTKDQQLAIEVIAALEELANSEAIEEFTYALDHPERSVPDAAKAALRPYLVSHATRLREIARSHPSMDVRRTLGVMLGDATATAFARADAKETSVDKRIASTRALLRSDNPERQKKGISLTSGYPELLPDVLELIRSVDYHVRKAAVELVEKMGIPDLTIENAHRLMGYSVQLDRHIAAYCYAKYGRRAVPLMMKAAFNLDDPLKLGPKHVPSPAVGLIRALVQEEVPDIEKAVVRLVKDERAQPAYVQLLELLDDSSSATLVGEFLRHDVRIHRLFAIRVVRARRLTQHADRLFELASFSFDQSEVDRLREALKKGAITSPEYNLQPRSIRDGPQDQHEATLALIDLGDPRAWQAVVTCLQGKRLVWREQSMVSPNIVTNFGAMVARLKISHRDDIHALLRRELQGENREHVVVSLTTALAMDPELADSDALWNVATSPKAHKKARILAAVGLSKLGERRVLPVLQEFVRSFIAPDPERKVSGAYPPGFSSSITPSMKWRMQNRRNSLLDYDLRRTYFLSKIECHHVDVGLALRRLGDETLVDELVAAFTDSRGGFDILAYRFLGGIIGLRAHEYAQQWMEQWNESQGVESTELLPVLAGMLLDMDVPAEKVLPLMVENDGSLPFNLYTLLGSDSKEAAKFLEQAYHNLSGRRECYRVQIIEALCRLGDSRGFALAAENPLLLASVVRYLPDAPGVDFPAGHFDYNRIEEGLRVQEWYEQHAGDLRWDPESSRFRLTGDGS